MKMNKREKVALKLEVLKLVAFNNKPKKAVQAAKILWAFMKGGK
jgi:hypothetical protein